MDLPLHLSRVSMRLWLGLAARGGSFPGTLLSKTKAKRIFGRRHGVPPLVLICIMIGVSTAQPQPTPTPFPLPIFQARDCHYVDPPFVIENNLFIVQRTFTDPNNPLAGGGAYWDFLVPSEGDYVIRGKVGMYDDGSNSFYLQVDGQPDTTMQFTSQQFTTGRQYRYVTWPAPYSSPHLFHLTAGVHRLYLRNREFDTELEEWIVEPSPTPTPFPLPTFQAADCHYLAAPFVISSNAISQPVQTADPAAGGQALFDFNVTVEGDYLVQGKVGFLDGGSNSFFVNIDAQPSSTMQFTSADFTPGGRANRYVTWPTPFNSPTVFHLTTGVHQLVLRGREADTEVESWTIATVPPLTSVVDTGLYNINEMSVDPTNGDIYLNGTPGVGGELSIVKVNAGSLTTLYPSLPGTTGGNLTYTNGFAVHGSELWWNNANAGPGFATQLSHAPKAFTGSITSTSPTDDLGSLSSDGTTLFTAYYAGSFFATVDGNGGLSFLPGYRDTVHLSIAANAGVLYVVDNGGAYRRNTNGTFDDLTSPANRYLTNGSRLGEGGGFLYALDRSVHNGFWKIDEQTHAATFITNPNFKNLNVAAYHNGLLYLADTGELAGQPNTNGHVWQINPDSANGGPPVITGPAANEAFDPVSNTWTTNAQMPTPRSNLTVGFSDRFYAAGGLTPTGNGSAIVTSGAIEQYDFADPNTGTPTERWATKTSMITARSDMGVGTITNKLYFAGGTNNAGSIVKTLEVYDPSTDTWTTKANMLTERSGAGAGVINGKLYVVGGRTTNSVVGTGEVYDPTAGPLGTWTPIAPMTTARDQLGVAVLNNKLYAIGGTSNSGTYYSTVEVYDPIGNAWMAEMPMNTARNLFAVGVVNGHIYVAGGARRNAAGDPIEVLDDVEEFNPTNHAWTPKAPMPTRRYGPAGVANNDRLYAIGGILAVTATINQPFFYQITATNHPATFGATGLPPGLSFDPTDPTHHLGIISGTPTMAGDFTVILTATNVSGTGTGSLKIGIKPAPVLALRTVSSTTATGKSGQPLNFQLLTRGGSSATQFIVSGLPTGLVLDSTTGLISGIPVSDGNFGLVVSAIDGATTKSTLQLTLVSDATVPIINSSDSATLVPNQPFSLRLTEDTSNPDTIFHTIGALPPNLIFDSATATISGTYTGASITPPTPNTIKIRPPLVAVIQTDANNMTGNGTGTRPLNFFAPAAGSRKPNGSGTFDVNLPLTGTPAVESRSGGANGNYQVVFAFPTAVTSFSNATVTPGPGGSASVSSTNISSDQKEVSVNLTNVSNGQWLTVTLPGVHDGINANTVNVTVQMG